MKAFCAVKNKKPTSVSGGHRLQQRNRPVYELQKYSEKLSGGVNHRKLITGREFCPTLKAADKEKQFECNCVFITMYLYVTTAFDYQ